MNQVNIVKIFWKGIIIQRDGGRGDEMMKILSFFP